MNSLVSLEYFKKSAVISSFLIIVSGCESVDLSRKFGTPSARGTPIPLYEPKAIAKESRSEFEKLQRAFNACLHNDGYFHKEVLDDVGQPKLKNGKIVKEKVKVECKEGDQKQRRDTAVYTLMYGIDVNYYDYERRLTRESQDVGFISKTIQGGLNLSAAVIDSGNTSQLLSQAAGGVLGIQGIYESEVLKENTISALQTTMRSSRKEREAHIVERLKQTTAEYTMASAYSDLQEYFIAGTLTGALLEFQKETGTKLLAEQAKVDKSKDTPGKVTEDQQKKAVEKAAVQR